MLCGDGPCTCTPMAPAAAMTFIVPYGPRSPIVRRLEVESGGFSDARGILLGAAQRRRVATRSGSPGLRLGSWRPQHLPPIRAGICQRPDPSSTGREQSGTSGRLKSCQHNLVPWGLCPGNISQVKCRGRSRRLRAMLLTGRLTWHQRVRVLRAAMCWRIYRGRIGKQESYVRNLRDRKSHRIRPCGSDDDRADDRRSRPSRARRRGVFRQGPGGAWPSAA